METYERPNDAGLGVLGDPTRRAIFELLGRRPQAVGELADQLPVSRPAVSQHLRALKRAGLVTDRALGTRRVYQLHPAGVAGLRAWLDRVWAHALAAFQEAVEADAPAHDTTPESLSQKEQLHKQVGADTGWPAIMATYQRGASD